MMRRRSVRSRRFKLVATSRETVCQALPKSLFAVIVEGASATRTEVANGIKIRRPPQCSLRSNIFFGITRRADSPARCRSCAAARRVRNRPAMTNIPNSSIAHC